MIVIHPMISIALILSIKFNLTIIKPIIMTGREETKINKKKIFFFIE